MRAAVCDLGTNSVRLDIYEFHGKHKFQLLYRNKEMVRLGEGVYESGKFSKEAIRRTLSTLEEYQQVCEEWKVNWIRAIATSAMREAKNAKKFAKKVLNETGFDFEIISGRNEAELILKGIELDELVQGKKFGFFDIGGGSTEIGVVKGSKHFFLESIPLGAVRLKQLFFLKKHSPKSIKKARKYIGETLAEHTKGVEIPEFSLMLGSSGTVKALQNLVGSKEGIHLKQLSRFIEDIAELKLDHLQALPGMNPGRADIIVPGAILAEEIMVHFNIALVSPTSFALRDGVLQELLEEFS